MKISNPTDADIAALRELWREAFGDGDVFLDLFFSLAFKENRSLCVKLDGELAAALYWLDCEQNGQRLAYIYAVATKRAYRGRGLCRELMKSAHAELAALGYAGAILVPGEKSLFEFYERLGYATCASIDVIECEAAAEGAPMRELSKDEYAAHRRKMLDAGGVIQENESLDLLENMAKFYTGDGFLLAARREGDTLFGLELLGNTRTAKKAVAALGCKRGRFRTPGSSTPFAMYHPLTSKTQAKPTYLGFAFD